jgi:hypothetical protein
VRPVESGGHASGVGPQSYGLDQSDPRGVTDRDMQAQTLIELGEVVDLPRRSALLAEIRADREAATTTIDDLRPQVRV